MGTRAKLCVRRLNHESETLCGAFVTRQSATVMYLHVNLGTWASSELSSFVDFLQSARDLLKMRSQSNYPANGHPGSMALDPKPKAQNHPGSMALVDVLDEAQYEGLEEPLLPKGLSVETIPDTSLIPPLERLYWVLHKTVGVRGYFMFM